MANIGNLVVRLQAQTEQFTRKMDDARKSVATFSDRAKDKLSSVVKGGFNIVSGAISAIIKSLTAGIGIATGFFAAMTVRAGTIKELQQLADVTGVGVENLQRWAFAAKSVGIESDKMGDIFKDAAEKLGELAISGGGEAAELFEKLGLDVKEFLNLPIDESLLRIARNMDGLTENERNALFEMLASDARELIPLLENNAELFREMSDEGERIGAILSQEAVDGAVKFRARWDDIIQRGQAFITQLTAEMAPSMDLILERIVAWIDSFGGMDKLAQAVAKTMIGMIRGTVQGIGEIVKWVYGLEAAWKKVQMATLATMEAALQLAKLSPAGFLANASGAIDIDGMIENTRGAGEALAAEVLKLQQFDPNNTPAMRGINNLLEELGGTIGGGESSETIPTEDKALKESLMRIQQMVDSGRSEEVRVNLDLRTDAGNLVGKVTGSREFAQAVQSLASQAVNNTARGVAA